MWCGRVKRVESGSTTHRQKLRGWRCCGGTLCSSSEFCDATSNQTYWPRSSSSRHCGLGTSEILAASPAALMCSDAAGEEGGRGSQVSWRVLCATQIHYTDSPHPFLVTACRALGLGLGA